MKENLYDPEKVTTLNVEDVTKIKLSSFYGKRGANSDQTITKDEIISRLIMLLDEIEDLDLAIKEDDKYFRDETRRIMEAELKYLRGKTIADYRPNSFT